MAVVVVASEAVEETAEAEAVPGAVTNSQADLKNCRHSRWRLKSWVTVGRSRLCKILWGYLFFKLPQILRSTTSIPRSAHPIFKYPPWYKNNDLNTIRLFPLTETHKLKLKMKVNRKKIFLHCSFELHVNF